MKKNCKKILSDIYEQKKLSFYKQKKLIKRFPKFWFQIRKKIFLEYKGLETVLNQTQHSLSNNINGNHQPIYD